MTYDDIPHLSAKIKPKQQKVGLPCDEARDGWQVGELLEERLGPLGPGCWRRSNRPRRRTSSLQGLGGQAREVSRKKVGSSRKEDDLENGHG